MPTPDGAHIQHENRLHNRECPARTKFERRNAKSGSRGREKKQTERKSNGEKEAGDRAMRIFSRLMIASIRSTRKLMWSECHRINGARKRSGSLNVTTIDVTLIISPTTKEETKKRKHQKLTVTKQNQ